MAALNESPTRLRTRPKSALPPCVFLRSANLWKVHLGAWVRKGPELLRAELGHFCTHITSLLFGVQGAKHGGKWKDSSPQCWCQWPTSKWGLFYLSRSHAANTANVANAAKISNAFKIAAIFCFTLLRWFPLKQILAGVNYDVTPILKWCELDWVILRAVSNLQVGECVGIMLHNVGLLHFKSPDQLAAWNSATLQELWVITFSKVRSDARLG